MQSIETVPKETLMLNLLLKDFIRHNRYVRELKDTILKEIMHNNVALLNGEYQQRETAKKLPNRNSGVEKYNK